MVTLTEIHSGEASLADLVRMSAYLDMKADIESDAIRRVQKGGETT